MYAYKEGVLLVKKAENKKERQELKELCEEVYLQGNILSEKNSLTIPDEFFGAYDESGNILGTIGLTSKTDKLLDVEKIFGITFDQKTIEICRLSWLKGLKPLQMAQIVSGLVYVIYLYAKANPMKEFVASVKPKTFSLLKHVLGRTAFQEVIYDKIIREKVRKESYTFYFGSPRPVIISTNYHLAKRGGEELGKILQTRIRFEI